MKRNPAYSQIMAQSLMKCRIYVAASLRSKNANGTILVNIAKEIEATLKAAGSPQQELFRAETEKAFVVFTTGKVEEEPRLDTPELQLLWGTVIGTLATAWHQQNPNLKLADTEVWKALVSHDVLDEQRRLCAQAAAAIPGLRERQGTLLVEWTPPAKGYPNVGFTYDPRGGAIHLDLAWSLIMGMEHAHSIILRNVAYSIGTLFFTQKMQDIRDDMAAIKRKETRTPEEHVQIVRLAAQWLARYDVMLAAESNYANSFVAELAAVSAQNYAASLNHAETVIGNIPYATPRFPANPDAKMQLNNICRALHFHFFHENDLFPNTADGWRAMGVEPDWIATTDGAKKGMEALEELQQMAKEMAALKPNLRDRLTGASFYAKRMQECSLERSAMSEQIFDRFAAHLLPELEQGAEDNPDETMDRMDQMSGEKKDKDGQKKDGKKDKKKGEKEEGEDGDEDGDEADVEGEGKKRDTKLPPKNPGEARGEGEPGEGEGEGEPGDGEGEPGDGEGEPGEGEGEPGDGDDDGELTENDPEDELDEDDPSDEGGGNGPGDTFSDKDPEAEDDGDYNEYRRIIEPHSGAIRRATDLMKKIQERLSIQIQDPSIKNSLVPEDNDITRFQPDALQDRLIKQYSGQPVDETDFETFRLDGPIRLIPAKTEIHIWIDGSGSMTGAPVETAITTGCILYEAAREAGMDVYIEMMGDPKTMPIAKPGMSDREIGKSIEAVKKGQGGNKDFLSPSVERMINQTVQQKGKSGEMVGNTHVFVVTDAGFSDGEDAIKAARAVGENCPHATMDFILIGHHPHMNPPLTSLSEELNKKAKRQPLSLKNVSNVAEIQDKLIEVLSDRLKAVKPGDAIPFRQKQKEFLAAKQKNKARKFGK